MATSNNLQQQTNFLYDSVTEYDIDARKDFDINFGSAKAVILSGSDDEKVRVRLASDTLSELQSGFKLKIDDVRSGLDLDLKRKKDIAEADAKEGLTIFVQLPNSYLGTVELKTESESIQLSSMKCESIELDIKTKQLALDGVTGTVEVNCNLDMEITCESLDGSVEINQLSADSRITVPKNTAFRSVTKGSDTSISYEKNGNPCEDFSSPDAKNVIELNGRKSKLVICASE